MRKHLLAIVAALSVVAIGAATFAALAPASVCFGVGINC